MIALLTDGRANISLDGQANRTTAAEDSIRIARALRASGTPSLVIDTGARPQATLRHLATELDAPYVPMPRADAHRLSDVVASTFGR